MVGLVVCGSVSLIGPAPASAQVTVVSGGAFGHFTKVSLFGGPSVPVGPLPDVRLPAAGSAQPLTGFEAAGSAVYGPAHIFGGVWPPVGVDIAPPSGPTTVSTRGTLGPQGSVTSSVDITLRNPPDPKSPGGWGPLPPTQGDELHSTCTASEAGVTGSVRFVNAVMSKRTTADGEPLDEEKIPDNPPVNFTREGVLTNVGDRYRIVYNEQFVEPDGKSITVNAVHMYLLGDIAIGEQIVGQVRCSVRGAPFPNTPPTVAQPPGTAPTTTAVQATTVPSATTTAPAPPTNPIASEESNSLPLIIAGIVLLALVMAAWLARGRRRGRSGLPHDP
ncbi:MAG TPA: hypothetical protein VJ653_01325 [Acidimicrobiales bacterium]|nr:hypothetical protein [Acidimicrobiales bacterium]